jgi:hypothetical protein
MAFIESGIMARLSIILEGETVKRDFDTACRIEPSPEIRPVSLRSW